ncbi:MAG: alkaline phosphatase D family protein [Rubripirellula sp.]
MMSLFPNMTPAERPDSNRLLSKILFGSCIKQEFPTPIFYTMSGEFPDLILFLGDNVYADTEDMAEMRACYDRLDANSDFGRMRAQFPILATWDDHDYGVNDGGDDYPQREASEQEFLRFWQVPEDSPIRSRPGVYDADVFGPEGQRVQIIMLDTRYFRSPLSKGERRVGGSYLPDQDPAKTMLGDRQWAWLERQLKKPAEIRIIGSSIQCIPEASGQETWGNLPRERDRLFQLIKDTNAEGVVIVSGDRHWAELSVLKDVASYPLYEMTSSSFNQIHPRGTPTDNQFRDDDRTYHRENYGVIRIDWTDDPSLTLEVKDMEGGIRLEKRIQLSELKP